MASADNGQSQLMSIPENYPIYQLNTAIRIFWSASAVMIKKSKAAVNCRSRGYRKLHISDEDCLFLPFFALRLVQHFAIRNLYFYILPFIYRTA
jgi:hypothetical protein